MTSYETLINLFFRRIEKDRSFFTYVGADFLDSREIAIERAKGLLFEAVESFVLLCHPTIDFWDRDDEQEIFNFDLTGTEKLIVSALMYKQYLQRDFSYLKTLSVNYTSTELRVFDPSNARNSFLNIYSTICAECDAYIDIYKNSNRLTGDFLGISFDAFDDSQE